MLEVGSIVEGKVAGITSFGAFIQLPDGKTGLVHISEIAEAYVRDIKDHLRENQQVRVKVLSMENGRISLSIRKGSSGRRAGSAPAEIDGPKRRREPLVRGPAGEIPERQRRKIHDLKKNFESKRGSGDIAGPPST